MAFKGAQKMINFIREWLRNKYTAKLENQLAARDAELKILTEKLKEIKERNGEYRNIIASKKMIDDGVLENYLDVLTKFNKLLLATREIQNRIIE